MSLMFIVLTILWVLLILSVLVIVHEFGHFLAAKLVKVPVTEFGLGYPPRVRQLFRWWDTTFTLNAIPIGGFVRLYGDDGEEIEKKQEAKSDQDNFEKQLASKYPEKAKFKNKPQWARLIIISAGVIFNFIFGILIFAVIYSISGIPTPTNQVEIVEVVSGSPADLAGIAPGAIVVELTKTDQEKFVKPTNNSQFINFIDQNYGQNVTVQWQLEGEVFSAQIVLPAKEDLGENEGALGVVISDYEMKRYPWWQMPWRGIWIGLQDALSFGWFILQMLGQMVSDMIGKGQVPQEVSGVVGIVDQAISARAITMGWQQTLLTTAGLSINLAIMNLLPIPMLDGGRGVFVMLESVLGRSRRQRWEEKANVAGFVFLMALLVLITIKDIWGFFV